MDSALTTQSAMTRSAALSAGLQAMAKPRVPLETVLASMARRESNKGRPRGIVSSKPGGPVYEILAWIAEHGPATCATLSRELDIPIRTVLKACWTLKQPTACKPKRLYVCDWTAYEEGQQPYPRPVFDIGTGKDKKRPADILSKNAKKKEPTKRQLGEVAAPLAAISVFHLGASYELKRAREREVLGKLAAIKRLA